MPLFYQLWKKFQTPKIGFAGIDTSGVKASLTSKNHALINSLTENHRCQKKALWHPSASCNSVHSVNPVKKTGQTRLKTTSADVIYVGNFFSVSP